MKKILAKIIWKFAGISPRCGNLVMDIFGIYRYCEISKLATK